MTVISFGSYPLRALDLGDAECNPIHSAVCARLDLDPHDPEVVVSQVLGWRDCPDLDDLGDDAQVYVAVQSAGDARGEVVWVK